MLSDPTSIYFQTELRFLPIEDIGFDKTFARDLYYQLAQPGGYPYDDLRLQEQPLSMSSKRVAVGSSGSSTCQIRPHSIRIEEIEPEVDEKGFLEIALSVLNAVAEVAGDSPPIFGQQCVIRCLAKPVAIQHSIDLLAGKVSNVLNAIEPFGRPPAFFGIRFRFPPVTISDPDGPDDAEPEEREDFVSLRFETWAQDIEQVWMEISAAKVFDNPIDVTETEKIAANFREAYEFLTEKGVGFLNQFDINGKEEKS